ncbi:multiple sugar transport system permease protein [Arcanobacterium pluranimalium]|uniref:carbohydrate ABC transporter permease n=1 Tax=Arcanobacterium pluranimalium TaxID=108028 RepID=UPI0019589420|nr:carbohydrate ABC transporter permease [Arcanobacterium pluranimalium]MBM7824326.1 multiple sugar transport system permease protein [Arcanobacterium pluranimalium]
MKQSRFEILRGNGIERSSTLGIIGRYALLILMLVIAVGPFLWQLSTSLKGPWEDIYSFPPNLIPQDPTLANYGEVTRAIPVVQYAWNSLFVSVTMVITNIVFSTCAGYALANLRFRGRGFALAFILSTLLLPGEVTLTSQYLTIKSMGLANTLVGVFLPTAITAINVLLMATACRSIPSAVIDAATIDGANTLQRLRYVVWPNVRGMASVVALMSFIQAWDDFLWPLVVLSDPAKYTLTVGMQYLNSAFAANPRVVAAGTMLALLPIIVLFAFTQKFFFRGVADGAVKG